MRHCESDHTVNCGCRTAGECNHNDFAWKKALDACVDDFAARMKEKLAKKHMQGKSGWDDPKWPRDDIIRQLVEHATKQNADMVDVGNFAMFAWNQGQEGGE